MKGDFRGSVPPLVLLYFPFYRIMQSFLPEYLEEKKKILLNAYTYHHLAIKHN
jgi:hypothetical protein